MIIVRNFSRGWIVACILVSVGLYLLQGQIFSSAVSHATHGQVHVDLAKGRTDVNVNGTHIDNQLGRVITGFPSDVPLPNQFDVTASTRFGAGYQATGRVPGAAVALASIRPVLRQRGWTESTVTATTVIATKETRRVIYATTPLADGAQLSVVVS